MHGLDKTMYRVSQHTGHSAAVSNVNSSVVQETPLEQGQSAPEAMAEELRESSHQS